MSNPKMCSKGISNNRMTCSFVFLMGTILVVLECTKSDLIYIDPTMSYSKLFKQIVASKMFVDKTQLIQTFMEPSEDEEPRVLLTGPTKFGKSVIQSMLLNFLEIPIDLRNGKIIEPRQCARHSFFYDNETKFWISSKLNLKDRHFAKYPVIFVDFIHTPLKFRGLTPSEQEQQLRNKIAQAIGRSILRYKSAISASGLQEGTELLTLIETTEDFDECLTLSLLPRFHSVLTMIFNRPIVLLVDEYDALIQFCLLQNADLSYVVNLIDSVFKSIMKAGGSIIDYAFITGISNLIRSETTSKVGMYLRNYPFLKEHRYTEFLGITEKEMKKIFETFNVNAIEQINITKYYYGYVTEQGLYHIYPIYSISKYFNNRYKFKSYWGEMGTLRVLHICLKSTIIRQKMQILSLNNSIKAVINHKIDVNQLLLLAQMLNVENEQLPKLTKSGSSSLYFTLLLELGLLTYTSEKGVLRIPNIEAVEVVDKWIHDMFQRNTIGIDAYEEDVQQSFLPILNGVNTNKEMLDNFVSSLKKLFFNEEQNKRIEKFGIQLWEMDFHFMLAAALAPVTALCKPELHVDKNPEGGDGYVGLGIVNELENILVFIEVKHNLPDGGQARQTAEEQIKNYNLNASRVRYQKLRLRYSKKLLINANSREHTVEILSCKTEKLFLSKNDHGTYYKVLQETDNLHIKSSGSKQQRRKKYQKPIQH